MRNYITDLQCIARNLSEPQFPGLTIKAVDLEVNEQDYWHLERMIADDVNQSNVKYIKPTTSLENGRMRGYIRVKIGEFTFHIYRQQKEEPTFKNIKPHSRFY